MGSGPWIWLAIILYDRALEGSPKRPPRSSPELRSESDDAVFFVTTATPGHPRSSWRFTRVTQRQRSLSPCTGSLVGIRVDPLQRVEQESYTACQGWRWSRANGVAWDSEPSTPYSDTRRRVIADARAASSLPPAPLQLAALSSSIAVRTRERCAAGIVPPPDHSATESTVRSNTELERASADGHASTY